MSYPKAASTVVHKTNMSSNSTTRYDVYDIDGTLTRPGHDLWYLTSKELAKDEAQFLDRVHLWKTQVAAGDDIVAASASMMQSAIQNVRDDVTAAIVQETCQKIAADLIAKGLVYSEWLDFVQARLRQGVTPILATTNYVEGAKAFVAALVDANWLTPSQAARFVCSGTIVDWKTRTLQHFNMHMGKALGIQKVPGLSELSKLQNQIENVFGDDPIGNDYGILSLTRQHRAWVVNTKKNSSINELPAGMQRMSWLHWTDSAKHRLPRGLMGIFGEPPNPNKRLKLETCGLPSITGGRDKHSGRDNRGHNDETKVVIVGGGFCGVTVTSLLQEAAINNDLNYLYITLIDPKDAFEYVGALPKSLVKDQQSCLPFDELISKDTSKSSRIAAKHVRGWVEVVEQSHVVVAVGEEAEANTFTARKIPYDHLVLATGSSYPAGIKHSFLTAVHGITRRAELQRQRYRVGNARSILLIGGGFVACEIATEIATAYPDKQVTMVDRHFRLLPRCPPSHDMLLQRLTELKIRVVLGETITHIDPDSFDYVAESGRTFHCDHAIWCGGPQPNAQLVPSVQSAFPSNTTEKTDEKKENKALPTGRGCLMVDQFLNLPGSNGRVWCGGDACILDDGVGEEAMAARAMHQGRVIASNILATEKAGLGPSHHHLADSASTGTIRTPVLTAYTHDRTSSMVANSMIVSLGGTQAMIISGDIPVLGPFRQIKEELECLLLQQLRAETSNPYPFIDPYTLLNQVNVETLKRLATRDTQPCFMDVLPADQQGILSNLQSSSRSLAMKAPTLIPLHAE